MHGRIKKEDKIDHLAGIVLNKKIGDKVEKGEILAYIHTNDELEIENARGQIEVAYEIENENVEEYKHILDVI